MSSSPITWCPDMTGFQVSVCQKALRSHLHQVWVAAGEVRPRGRRRWRRTVSAWLLHKQRIYQRRQLVVGSVLLLVHLSLVTLGHGGVAGDRPHCRHQLHLPRHDVVHCGSLGKRVRASTVAYQFSRNNKDDI